MLDLKKNVAKLGDSVEWSFLINGEVNQFCYLGNQIITDAGANADFNINI